MFSNDIDDARLVQFCKEKLDADPQATQYFQLLGKAIDELFKVNQQPMAVLGERIVRACLQSSLGLDPNEIFKKAVETAERVVNDFAAVQHAKNRDKVIEIMNQCESDQDEQM